MKKKGNEKFQSQEYEEAVKFYSKAIKLNPENHMVYGNRALCFIRCKNYHKAMCDGKRAILIDPLWPKGHYRFCEALSLLGERKLAIEANKLGRHLCGSDQEGYKDLEQQYQKFVTEMGEASSFEMSVLMFFVVVFQKPEVVNVKAAVCKELKSVVHDAHTALTDLRSRNAEQAFSQALVTVEANNPKFSVLHSSCLVPSCKQELGEAQRLLQKIKSYEERTFQCLVFYAIGRVYLRENRFAVALEQFSDSLQMVKNQITPGKLTWPLTKEIVKETQPDYFKDILENNLELCRFPPAPDAVCRLVKCLGHSKTEIYITDPNFKGFIEISCCQSCTIEYHIACWKTLKTSAVFEKSEKDFLLESCFTPDCVGKICNIKIYGPTGLLKCKKLKSKEQHRQKRRQFKQSFQNNQVINEESPQKKEDSTSQTWLLYRDRVLLQISQNMELLREEKGLHVSTLTGTLKPWLELDLSKGNQIAQRILNLQQEEQPDLTLGHTVELLLERKNRVWARVFVEVLSSCEDLNPKLNNWACHLNDAGLNAAKSFIERYAGHLEQLDLAFLLNFSPLQEVIIEKFGTRPEPFSSIGLTVTEYLKQAPPHDMRLFIWTLEEHRDDYVSCHSMLDEYFDMMGTYVTLLSIFILSSVHFRRRKKKHREPMVRRSRFMFHKYRDCVSNRSFLHPADPFSVPSHLREQVADFEEQYNSTRHGSHYKNILDNNPDPTKESLYDYFAQILEEHGPLEAEDRLLVGELDNFPPVAQEKIQEAGGFKSFLLESLRFIQMGRCIGLTKHAVSLQEVGHRASLDDLDDLNNLDELDELMDPQTRNPYFDSNTGHEAGDLNKKQKRNKMLELQIKKISNSRDKVELRHKEDLAVLEEDIQKVTVTNTELALFQQKLEEEVKKDQNEKKANQEALKSLKVEIENLVEEQRGYGHHFHLNQSAAEKMSLEDEIKRCKASLTSASRRSKNAQVGHNSYSFTVLRSRLKCGESNLLWLSGSFSFLSDTNNDLVKLFLCFRSELMKFFQELRSSNGGTLSSMALQDMVGGVSQLILDHQEQLHSAPISSHTGRRTPAQSVTPPLTYSVPVWQTTGPPRSAQSSALNVEDPCIICHDDMSPDDICVLECRHSFHNECIRSWLKEQSTCPTCRDHALLPEEFPPHGRSHTASCCP
uniref:RING-type E3 ubiquitin transferase n=1 Tax=Labrus bergylta TaxID=56723 RepID=A0A3Q3LLN6_9LABR